MTNKCVWPSTIPDDLHRKLLPILEARSRPLAADVWTTLREWLIEHGLDVPEDLPTGTEWSTIPPDELR